MKITEVIRFVGYSVETDDKYYSRYSPTCWYLAMGESEETWYTTLELVKKFQEFMLVNDEAGNVVEESDAER